MASNSVNRQMLKLESKAHSFYFKNSMCPRSPVIYAVVIVLCNDLAGPFEAAPGDRGNLVGAALRLSLERFEKLFLCFL